MVRRSIGRGLVVACGAVLVVAAQAGTPEVWRYLGAIHSLDGAPPPDGRYEFRVRILDAAEASPGSQHEVFVQSGISAEVERGIMTLVIGPGQDDPARPGLIEVLQGSPRFLEVTVTKDSRGRPRNEVVESGRPIPPAPSEPTARRKAPLRSFLHDGPPATAEGPESRP